MLNLKIFSIESSKHDLENIRANFNSDSFFELSDSLIGIEYFGDSHEYIDVLKSAKTMGLSQFLFTSRKFLKVISFIVKEDFMLDKIEFVYPITKDSGEFINKQIESIYAAYTDSALIDKHLNKLLEEIEWLAVDDCIDIKSISFDFQSEEDNLYQKITVFNNGVVTLPRKQDVSVFSKLLRNMRSLN